jgi:hypothetical protein
MEDQTLFIKVRGTVRPDELNDMIRPHYEGEDKSIRELMEIQCLAVMNADIRHDLQMRHIGKAVVETEMQKGTENQQDRFQFAIHVTGGSEEDRATAQADIARWLTSEYEPTRHTIAQALSEMVDRYPVRVEAEDAKEIFGGLRDSVTADIHLSIEQAGELLDLMDRYGRSPGTNNRVDELRDKLIGLVTAANERLEPESEKEGGFNVEHYR